MKTFAILKKADGSFVGEMAAENKAVIHERYPASDFRVHDMTNKGRPPSPPGLDGKNITVNKATGEWELQGVTEAELLETKKNKKLRVLERRLCGARVIKTQAATDGLADLEAEIDAEIAEIEGEIAALSV